MRKEKEEKRTTTLHGQEKKTAQRKETTSNRPNMKTSETKPVIVSPISKLPGTKRIEVKEAHVRTNLRSSAGTTAMRKEKEKRKEMTLRGQDRKEEKKEMTLFKSEDEMAKLMEVLMELAFSSYMEYKKRVRDPHAFRCFVELSRLRKSSEVQGGISKDSLLLALIESATDINPEFTISQQNDAHEFLCHCLTQMEESGRWLGWQEDVDPRCPVRANFKFKMRNIITCSSCGSQQNKVEVFNHISLPLVHNSVDQCLYDIVNNPTVLESKCKVCGGECANSRWTFHTLPRFLILQLNRFKVTEYYTVVKLHMPVEIKPELQINCHPESDMPGIENSKAESRETDRNELGGSAATYRLISVLSHVGSTTLCGHYLSDCSSSSQQWMTYNDQRVTLTTETDVLKMRSTSAYVLLYERVSTG
ncbi:hypothetical protein PHYPO_G00190150 [Pangasianodon hypophthalmus]|uniref:USP domain-containing protein n=1 Tax=Pangasianodon hypophthalmus TaxID=310915 RepID=A0A5N5PJG8_PANHP|nr:hypothetical protein PHYPO_G00190150 [Pangasianodon hypophthalmus]